MMNVMRLMGLAALCLAASCGPLSKGTTAAQVGALAKARVAGAPQPSAPAGASAAPANAAPGTTMRINIRDMDRWETLALAARNGNRITWVNGRDISVTTESGVVVATRGLPRDLMGADVSGTVRAMQNGGGNTPRTHEYLTNIDGISMELLQCRIASKGAETIETLQRPLNSVRFEEECASENLRFTNIYWLNRNGGMIRSLQAVTPEVGYLQIDVF